MDDLRGRVRAALALRITGGDGAEALSPELYLSPDAVWDALEEANLDRFSPRVAEAAELLGLDPLSTEVLWLCAAPELDERWGRVFAFLHDNAQRRVATPRLVAALLSTPQADGSAILARLDAAAPLRRRGCVRLLETEPTMPLADQPIRVAGELTAFLLGSALDDGMVDTRLARQDVPTYPVGRDEARARIRAALAAPGRAPVLVGGPDAPHVLTTALDRGLVLLDARAAVDHELLARASLMAALERRALALDRCELLDAEDRVPIDALPDRLFLCTALAEAIDRLGRFEAIEVTLRMPSLQERRAAWSALAEEADTAEVAAKFRLSVGQIARAVGLARAEAELAGKPEPAAAELDAGARQASASGLGQRATRLQPSGDWRDLVLPERQLEVLGSIAAYLRHRDQVLTEWGFESMQSGRQGLGILFAGESGTGKTMAATVLAAQLGLELFSIDLATVVSKYVGETEQNLERIFSAATNSNAILFFDEADALFARRSEVSDARDRYANLEVAFLLQRMEAHPGAVILATNLKQNIDDAFLRRLDFVVEFKFPEAADRRRLWRLLIPTDAPVAADLDLDFLAERFKLSGGSIRNCSLAAAFEAAAAGRPIRMAHLVRAVAAEYGKLGRLTVEADFGPYAGMLRDTDAAPNVEPLPVAEEAQPMRAATPTRIGSRIDEL